MVVSLRVDRLWVRWKMRKKSLLIIPLSLFVTCIAPGILVSRSGAQGPAVRESHVPVGGANLFVREVGTGPPIIVLHGGPDFDQSYMLPEMDRLADRYHLIYYDQRGRGKSAKGVKPDEVTLASDISDIEKVRQYFHLDTVTLLGHSWGTVLALEYALKYPGRVSHLIVMNPGPASREDYVELRKEWLEKRADLVTQKKAIAETQAYKEGDPEAVTAYYRIHFTPAFARKENYEKLITRMHADFTKDGVLKARAVEDRLMQETWAKADFDLLPQLKTLKLPTLVLSGDHEFIPASSAEHIANAIPNAHLATMKDCGHFTYMECPVPVHSEIDALFAERSHPHQ